MSTVSPEPGFLEDHPEEKPAPDAELAEGEEGASRVRRVLRCALPAALALLLVGLGVGFAMTMGSSSGASSLNTNPNEAKDKPDKSEAKRTETVGNIDKAKVEEKAEEAKQNVSETPAASTTNNNSNTNSNTSSSNTSSNTSAPSNNSNSSTPTPAPDPAPAPTPTPEPPAHVHTPVAVTKQVEKYEQQWVPNMVTKYFYTCSYCGTHTYSAQDAVAHQKQEALATGTVSSYYSDSSSIDEGSYQDVFVGCETVSNGYVCSGCGATM